MFKSIRIIRKECDEQFTTTATDRYLDDKYMSNVKSGAISYGPSRSVVEKMLTDNFSLEDTLNPEKVRPYLERYRRAKDSANA